MDVGAALYEAALARGARAIAVVGTSKNAGKSVVVAALADALGVAGVAFGICSIGRDGEALDAVDGGAKPRFRLRPGAAFATARTLFPRSPAAEVLAETGERSALGSIVLGRVRAAGEVELAGPPRAAAMRRVGRALSERCAFVLVDGAVDRIAALAGGDEALVVAVGTAAPALGRALDEVEALVARLRLPAPDPAGETLAIAGALTASRANELVRAGERRQIVVDDPTHVVFGGRTYLAFASRLDLRAAQTLRPIACTVAPLGRERSFDPVAFARAVARRTGLPTYDVFAGSVARPTVA